MMTDMAGKNFIVKVVNRFIVSNLVKRLEKNNDILTNNSFINYIENIQNLIYLGKIKIYTELQHRIFLCFIL
jgi:hypothetical protein